MTNHLVQRHPSSVIHASTVVGYGVPESKLLIDQDVTIGAFCVLYFGAVIGKGVDIDHYCRVGQNSCIGENTKILYGSQIFNNATIGRNCIIGGHVSERVVIEDDVTFMGEIAHSHRDPTADWDTTDEPSPTFRQGCVVGVGAQIMGGINIGEGAYIAAHEHVRTDVEPDTLVYRGRRRPISEMRGFIKSRSH